MEKRKERKRLAYQRMRDAETQEQHAARLARQNLANKRYRATHPHRPYKCRPREQVVAARRRFYFKNRQRVLAKQAFYYARNRERILSENRKRYATEVTYRAKLQLSGHQRRKFLRESDLSLAQWLAVYRFYEGNCVYCGRAANTMDHILPLSRGGTHTVDNVTPACKSCNSRKRTRTPTEWYRAQAA